MGLACPFLRLCPFLCQVGPPFELANDLINQIKEKKAFFQELASLLLTKSDILESGQCVATKWSHWYARHHLIWEHQKHGRMNLKWAILHFFPLGIFFIQKTSTSDRREPISYPCSLYVDFRFTFICAICRNCVWKLPYHLSTLVNKLHSVNFNGHSLHIRVRWTLLEKCWLL